MSADHSDRMQRAIDRHTGLLDALLGPWKHNYPLHMIVLGEMYELSDEEGAVIDALIDRLKAAFAAYCYSVDDVAAHFKISPSTVKRIARKYSYFGIKVGGRWRFADHQIERYLRENTSERTAELASGRRGFLT